MATIPQLAQKLNAAAARFKPITSAFNRIIAKASRGKPNPAALKSAWATANGQYNALAKSGSRDVSALQRELARQQMNVNHPAINHFGQQMHICAGQRASASMLVNAAAQRAGAGPAKGPNPWGKMPTGKPGGMYSGGTPGGVGGLTMSKPDPKPKGAGIPVKLGGWFD